MPRNHMRKEVSAAELRMPLSGWHGHGAAGTVDHLVLETRGCGLLCDVPRRRASSLLQRPALALTSRRRWHASASAEQPVPLIDWRRIGRSSAGCQLGNPQGPCALESLPDCESCWRWSPCGESLKRKRRERIPQGRGASPSQSAVFGATAAPLPPAVALVSGPANAGLVAPSSAHSQPSTSTTENCPAGPTAAVGGTQFRARPQACCLNP
mmetsp:Transcript_58494/g.174071  ORF Transcript_58494/g.174071 Transcript_58494/m.174071 type:complete len:211 (+) Transcript_58494:197-829(+)